MKKYILLSMMVVGLVGLYSYRSQLIGMDPGETPTATSSSISISQARQPIPGVGPQVCLKVGEQQYCFSWQAAQLSGTLKDMLADIAEPDDEDEEEQEYIEVPVLEFSASEIEVFIRALRGISQLKQLNLTWNNTKIEDTFLKKIIPKHPYSVSDMWQIAQDPTLFSEISLLTLAKLADYYDVPLLLQAVARWPVIILGDFNMMMDCKPSGEQAYQKMIASGYLFDVRDVAQQKHIGPDGTFIGFSHSDWMPKEGQEPNRFDHIFVSKGIGVIREGVINDRVHNGIIYSQAGVKKYKELNNYEITKPSDHAIVVADIMLE